MSAYHRDQVKIADLGSLNLGAGTGTVILQPGVPIDVESIILVVTTAQATAGAVLTVQTREADGSGGEVTIGTATTPAVMALNSVYEIDVAQTKSTALTDDGVGISQSATVSIGGRVVGRQSSEPGLVEVNPGREFIVTSGGEGDTGVATVYVKYYEQGEAKDRYNPTQIVFTLS